MESCCEPAAVKRFLLKVAVADGRGKGEAAFYETVVHFVVKTYEQVGVEFGVAGFEIDEDVY